MKNLNQFSITGFIGNDAEISAVGNNKKARFSVALNETKKVGEEEQKVTTWINFEAIRKPENAAEFNILKKGTKVTIHGRFAVEDYDKKDGTHVNGIAFIATKCELFTEDEKEEAK